MSEENNFPIPDYATEAVPGVSVEGTMKVTVFDRADLASFSRSPSETPEPNRSDETLEERNAREDAEHEQYLLENPPQPFVPKPRTIILHHRDSDGYAAAAIAASSVDFDVYDTVTRGVQYGEEVPDLAYSEDDVLIIVDFSYKKEILLDLKSKVKSILVLDHHESAMEELQDLDFAKFDMTKSGALMAWEHFVPEYAQMPPDAIQLLDCYDLWDKTRPDFPWDKVVAFQMACEEQKGNMTFWNSVVNGYHIDPAFMLFGQDLYSRFLTKVKQVKASSDTEFAWIDGQQGMMVFLEKGVNVSLMADALYCDPELSISWVACLLERNDNWICSLRGKDKSFPVLPWAKKLGGGGHALAASASVCPLEGVDRDAIKQLVKTKLAA